jgi:hypothetical protein
VLLTKTEELATRSKLEARILISECKSIMTALYMFSVFDFAKTAGNKSKINGARRVARKRPYRLRSIFGCFGPRVD